MVTTARRSTSRLARLRLPVGVTAAVVLATLVAAPGATTAATPTIQQLIGQKLIIAMDGTTPSTSLLYKIRTGQIGGVVLFSRNFSNATTLRAITAKLRNAASVGGQPHFVIAVDQEGGQVKRISWAPPTMSAYQMGVDGRTSVAYSQGASTASALRGLGLNVDFAPVADVPTSYSSFMYLQHRTFSFSPSKDARLTDGFSRGLESGHVMPVMKHFPGIGRALLNTDSHVVTINASAYALSVSDLVPYRTGIADHIPMIMLSNATYPAYDATNAAGWSHAIAVTLLRTRLGFTGVTVTDSLTGTAAARGIAQWRLAVKAAHAGTDMILLTGSESSSALVYYELVKYSQSGYIARSVLQASYTRVLALKARL
jgi:beta-N-acetylhexosaminidase